MAEQARRAEWPPPAPIFYVNDKKVEVQLSETIFDQRVRKEQEQVEDEEDIFSLRKLKFNYQKRFLIRGLEKNKNRWRMRWIFLVRESWQSYNRKI